MKGTAHVTKLWKVKYTSWCCERPMLTSCRVLLFKMSDRCFVREDNNHFIFSVVRVNKNHRIWSAQIWMSRVPDPRVPDLLGMRRFGLSQISTNVIYCPRSAVRP
eukprot:jgi/Botrbrau1/21168/Bobra.0061s0060.1